MQLIFWWFSVAILFMYASEIDFLGPRSFHYQTSLSSRPVRMKVQAELRQISVEQTLNSANPLIQNYYCEQQEGELVKVTVIKLGNQFLRLTDRLSVVKQSDQKQPNKVKDSQKSSTDTQSRSDSENEKLFFSKASKTILKMFVEWIRSRSTECLQYVESMQECLPHSEAIFQMMASDPTVRGHLLHFIKEITTQSRLSKKILKVARDIKIKCRKAREDERRKEQYIEQVLGLQVK